MAAQRDESRVGRSFGAGYAIVGAGFQLAFSILMFAGLGYWADRKLDTRPAFMLMGLLLGLGAGMYAFLRRVMAESKRDGTGR